MGTYSNGANGAFTGKVGSMIGSSWRGITYLKGLPRKSTKPATEAQLAQRAKFAMVPVYLRPIKDILNLGFGDKQLTKLTAYNAAARLFLTEAIIGTYPDFSVDFSKMTLSKGAQSTFHNLSMVLQGSDLGLSWENLTNSYNSFADDKLVVVIFNETKQMYSIYENVQRADLSSAITLGSGFAADVLHGWAFSTNRDSSSVSNSQYLGSIIVP
ncbi:DUF6266 family protein [Pedobacter sp. AW1-32]|uniref:DUF6266 family protein n=1 Tax=Pedobacter sp. AW1-32 TaxID=3383026 RepID=UPI003FEED50C